MTLAFNGLVYNSLTIVSLFDCSEINLKNNSLKKIIILISQINFFINNNHLLQSFILRVYI